MPAPIRSEPQGPRESSKNQVPLGLANCRYKMQFRQWREKG